MCRGFVVGKFGSYHGVSRNLAADFTNTPYLIHGFKIRSESNEEESQCPSNRVVVEVTSTLMPRISLLRETDLSPTDISLVCSFVRLQKPISLICSIPSSKLSAF
jgi:hypothetical protein